MFDLKIFKDMLGYTGAIGRFHSTLYMIDGQLLVGSNSNECFFSFLAPGNSPCFGLLDDNLFL